MTVVRAGAEHLAPAVERRQRPEGVERVLGVRGREAIGERLQRLEAPVPVVDQRAERDPVAEMRAEIDDAVAEHEPGERPAVGRRERPECEAG